MTTPRPSTALRLLRNRSALQKHPLSLIRSSTDRQGPSQGSVDFELGLGITELAGSAGCGKTQIALGICVACACTPLNPNGDGRLLFGKALYVSLGEGNAQIMIAKRLHQMADIRKVELNLHEQPTSAILNKIRTRQIRNQDEFEQFIFQELPELLRQDKAIAVLAMDSIASMFRIYESKPSFEIAIRSGQLFRIAAQLKKLSKQHTLPILIVNQVTADFSSLNGSCVMPALGLSWASCVDESFVVAREETTTCCTRENEADKVGGQLRFQRTIRCRFSSMRIVVETDFIIDDGGARATDTGIILQQMI